MVSKTKSKTKKKGKLGKASKKSRTKKVGTKKKTRVTARTKKVSRRPKKTTARPHVRFQKRLKPLLEQKICRHR